VRELSTLGRQADALAAWPAEQARQPRRLASLAGWLAYTCTSPANLTHLTCKPHGPDLQT